MSIHFVKSTNFKSRQLEASNSFNFYLGNEKKRKINGNFVGVFLIKFNHYLQLCVITKCINPLITLRMGLRKTCIEWVLIIENKLLLLITSITRVTTLLQNKFSYFKLLSRQIITTAMGKRKDDPFGSVITYICSAVYLLNFIELSHIITCQPQVYIKDSTILIITVSLQNISSL